LKILKLTAENIKKLRVVEITPAGNVVEITGPNASGKSSVLDSIYYALAGAKEIPSQPIRRGALKAKVKLELGEITVERRFSQSGGSSLVVEAADGSSFTSPQKMLDKLLGTLTFDPLAFTRMDAKKQLEELKNLVPLDVDLDAIEKANLADFEARTELSRKVRNLEPQIGAIAFPDDTPDDEVSVADLVEELRAAGEKNTANERVKREREIIAGSIQDRLQRARDSRDEAARLMKRAEDLELSAISDEKIAHENTDRLEAIVVPDPVDTSELAQMIEGARQVNAEIANKKLKLRLAADLATVKGTIEALGRKIDGRNELKREAIAAAKMPIDGLSFGENEVLYRNLPFNQASGAEQLRVSTAIAMKANPKLRILRISDGSLLDEHSMKLLGEMADANDFQIWIERVDTSGKVGVVMEDGEVKA
jgi:DNA repair exonuclease SbcCD ATPase subunit